MLIAILILFLPLITSQPCPHLCSCTFNSISCPELIKSCLECHHWSRIDFNQITHLGPNSFENFSFSPNQTTLITIYKLLNSSIGAQTFNKLIIKQNSIVQITFQYNSLIKFEPYSLDGLSIHSNSSLIFNFPFTTQVIVSLSSLNGIKFDTTSRLLFRIFKSFSVLFLSQQGFKLNNGKVIFDIKATHLVKFEDKSFKNEISNSNIYLDLEAVEKVIFYKGSFENQINIRSNFILHLKQISFIDIKPGSFNSITVKGGFFRVYLSELTASMCVQPNTISNLKLADKSIFNFSVIYSKNVQFMKNSVSDVSGQESTFFIGVFDEIEDNEYNSFISERSQYIKLDEHDYSFEFINQYYYNKQKYSYNFSIEKNAFSSIDTEMTILGDNLDTMYFDDQFILSKRRVKILLNVKNLVISDQGLEYAPINEILFISKSNVIRKPEEKTFIKQWEYCINEGNIDHEVSNIISHSSFYYEESDNQIDNNTSQVNKTTGQMTGFVIIGLILFILFLILVVNLIQYKYRGDSFDDLDTSSQNQSNNVSESLIKQGEQETRIEESTQVGQNPEIGNEKN